MIKTNHTNIKNTTSKCPTPTPPPIHGFNPLFPIHSQQPTQAHEEADMLLAACHQGYQSKLYLILCHLFLFNCE